MMTLFEIDATVRAYAECAVWSSSDWSDPEAEPVSLESAGYSADDISPEALASMTQDVTAFVDANIADLSALAPAQVGHDFWLTRNRHGAGFWDRGLGAVGQRLTDAAHAYGESDLHVGDDGQLHV